MYAHSFIHLLLQTAVIEGNFYIFKEITQNCQAQIRLVLLMPRHKLQIMDRRLQQVNSKRDNSRHLYDIFNNFKNFLIILYFKTFHYQSSCSYDQMLCFLYISLIEHMRALSESLVLNPFFPDSPTANGSWCGCPELTFGVQLEDHQPWRSRSHLNSLKQLS